MVFIQFKRVFGKEVVFIPVLLAAIVAAFLILSKEKYVVNYNFILNENFVAASSFMDKDYFLEEVYNKTSKKFKGEAVSYAKFKDQVKIIGDQKNEMVNVSLKGTDKKFMEEYAHNTYEVAKNKLVDNLTDDAYEIFTLKNKIITVSARYDLAKKDYQSVANDMVKYAFIEGQLKGLAEMQASLEVLEEVSRQINVNALSNEIYAKNSNQAISMATVNGILQYYYLLSLKNKLEDKLYHAKLSQDWKLNRITGEFKARAIHKPIIAVVIITYILSLLVVAFSKAALVVVSNKNNNQV